MERKKSVVTNQCTTGTLSVFFIALVSSMLMSMSIQQVSGLSQNSRTTPTRRSVLRTIISSTVPISTLVTATTTTLSPLAAEAKEKMSIADRLDATELTVPPPSRATELNGVDNLYYPSWLSGTWDVTQTLIAASTPLGLKFIGGPNGSEAIAAESFKEQTKQMNVPVKLQLRFVTTKFGVAEDRIFNTRERLDSFAGRKVVSSIEYSNVGGSNRQSALALGGSEDTPLQTTFVRFKGPAAQKTFVLGHRSESYTDSESDPDKLKFAASESLRSIFALTNQNTAPPVTTDSENIWVFEKDKGDDDTIVARLRLASYLNAQSDSLYFDAKNRSVSFADYKLTFKRAA